MSKDSTLKTSKTDWKAIEKMGDKDIDLSEIPEVTAEQMLRAKMRAGGKPVSRGKVRVNIYLDSLKMYHKDQAPTGSGRP